VVLSAQASIVDGFLFLFQVIPLPASARSLVFTFSTPLLGNLIRGFPSSGACYMNFSVIAVDLMPLTVSES
jgi:hypothetical protein